MVWCLGFRALGFYTSSRRRFYEGSTKVLASFRFLGVQSSRVEVVSFKTPEGPYILPLWK